MTDSAVSRTVDVLLEAGFRPEANAVAVGGIPFEFNAVLTKQDSLELVVVIDALEMTETRMVESMEGLARALDLVESRRSVTAVLVGPPPPLSVIHALGKVCRVLVTGTPIGADATNELRDALAVLLPLELAVDAGGPIDSWSTGKQNLEERFDDKDSAAIFRASAKGAAPVEAALKRALLTTLAQDGDAS